MKKLTLLIIIALSTTGWLQAQTINPDFLQGKWQINLEATMDAIPTQLKAGYDSLVADAKEKISNKLARQQMRFHSNGMYETIIVDGPVYAGLWSLDSDNLRITFSGGTVIEQKIASLSEDELVLQVESDPNSSEYFHYFHLTLLER